MRQAKWIGVALWITNILLVVGIGVTFFNYLLFPPKVNLAKVKEMIDFADGPRGPDTSRKNYATIFKIPNPMTPKKGPDPVTSQAVAFQAILIGTFPPDFAFLRIGSDETLAEIGKKIMVKGTVALPGWYMSECYSDHAMFTDGKRSQRLELTVPSVGAGGTMAMGGGRKGQKYDPDSFKTRKIHSSASREVWLMDPKEIQWAMENFQTEMEKNVTVSPTANGLRITGINTGSIGISRGLKSNDVIRSVNGHSMKSLTDIKKMQNDPRNQRRRSMTIVVQRAGRNMVLEYRANSSGDR